VVKLRNFQRPTNVDIPTFVVFLKIHQFCPTYAAILRDCLGGVSLIESKRPNLTKGI